MTQEEKELLTKDLCARLPYSTLCYCKWTKDVPNGTSGCVQEVSTYLLDELMIIGDQNYECQICEIRPYLRPMSSMTEEEDEWLNDRITFSRDDEIDKVKQKWGIVMQEIYTNSSKYVFSNFTEILDWLNEHHFDYRGLIEKGFALAAPEGMYK